jgi:5,10-methylene-tetrahydrofolate dehydrogenase/methenyl tetrahydrofolate cyclohydrolase
VPPGLAVIIVGSRKDSQTYVKLKHKAAEECGFRSIQIELAEDITQSALHAEIESLNRDPAVHGILVQLPLPKHIDEASALELIDPHKDVDGLHPVNVGLLHTRGKTPHFTPCTPLGVVELLKRSGVGIAGKRACVIGRSNIVGLPVAQLLLRENATVTICHSRTERTAEIVKECDIVVAACGQAELVRGDWIKQGACVIDVGTNPIDDSSRKVGYRLVGDVAYEEVRRVAGRITPVPGGVGPMTIAMLIRNTFDGFRRSATFQ